MTTFEQYLKVNVSKGIIDHSLRCSLRGNIAVFYIHATGKDSDTPDFFVVGNELRHMPDAATCSHPKELEYRYPITNAITKNSVMGRYCLCGHNNDTEIIP